MYEKFIKDELQIRIDEAKQNGTENIDCSVSFATEVMALINVLEEESNNALNQLRERLPRIMTLSEAVAADVCWLEDKKTHTVTAVGLSYEFEHKTVNAFPPGHFATSYEAEKYGKTYRCWTAKPDRESINNTKWE